MDLPSFLGARIELHNFSSHYPVISWLSRHSMVVRNSFADSCEHSSSDSCDILCRTAATTFFVCSLCPASVSRASILRDWLIGLQTLRSTFHQCAELVKQRTSQQLKLCLIIPQDNGRPRKPTSIRCRRAISAPPRRMQRRREGHLLEGPTCSLPRSPFQSLNGSVMVNQTMGKSLSRTKFVPVQPVRTMKATLALRRKMIRLPPYLPLVLESEVEQAVVNFVDPKHSSLL